MLGTELLEELDPAGTALLATALWMCDELALFFWTEGARSKKKMDAVSHFGLKHPPTRDSSSRSIFFWTSIGMINP